MAEVEIKRGYEVLPDNNIRFGIRVTNTDGLVITDVEVTLYYPESLFSLEADRHQNLGNISPASTRTAEFLLKPLGCVHEENIEAHISYRDPKGRRHSEDMQPKKVHCVCPFLKGLKVQKAEFLELSGTGHSAETGLNFEGVSVERLTSFLVQTCHSRHYKVDELSIDGGRMLYLASESIGEKAYYLLTVLIKDDGVLTQVMLRAVSDKPHGLNGFLNETVADLRHVVETVQSAREIGVIRKEQVINIIDSVVQRTTFGGGEGVASVNIQDSVVQRTTFGGGEGVASVNIQDSVVQRTEFGAGGDKKAEEERKRKEEQENQRQDEMRRVAQDTAREKQKRMAKKKSKTSMSIFILVIVFSMLLVWFVMLAPSSDLSGLDSKKDPVADALARAQSALESGATTPIIETGRQYESSLDASSPAVSTLVTSPNQKTITNSIGMEFVLIPAGEFNMGSSSSEEGWGRTEMPAHKVEILEGFYMGKYEITQKQWREVMGDNPSYSKGDDLPVEQVSWDDVQVFIKKLNQKEGLDKYRLPSEAEWEYAARAGTTTQYSFGDDESRLGEYAWYDINSGYETHIVGQKRPNPWGLYDMHGNVWEWVQDNFNSDYRDAPTDASAWERDDDSRVYRGGGWGVPAQACRSAFRNYYSSGGRSKDIGFRLLEIL